MAELEQAKNKLSWPHDLLVQSILLLSLNHPLALPNSSLTNKDKR
jgi:hypothetical protein